MPSMLIIRLCGFHVDVHMVYIAYNTWCIQKIPRCITSMMSPGQSYALPVILWVKSAELLIGRSPRQPGEMPREDVSKMPPCRED